MNSNGSLPLHSSTDKSRELNHELQKLPGAECILHCSMEGKTSHQHTRTEHSTLKSRGMIFSQRFFNPAFSKGQLHCHYQTTQEQKCSHKRVRELCNIPGQSAFFSLVSFALSNTELFPPNGNLKKTSLCLVIVFFHHIVSRNLLDFPDISIYCSFLSPRKHTWPSDREYLFLQKRGSCTATLTGLFLNLW